jgi:hypothetical protein
VADKVATQFARSRSVFRLLPAPERFRGANRKSGVRAKGVEEAVRAEPLHVSAIPLLRVMECAIRQQPDLLHRERLCPDGHLIPAELERRFESRAVGRHRAAKISRSRRGGVLLRGSGAGHCENGAEGTASQTFAHASAFVHPDDRRWRPLRRPHGSIGPKRQGAFDRQFLIAIDSGVIRNGQHRRAVGELAFDHHHAA